ncbi:hypothetical protein STTU_1934 [Streptomyces sp. Tu6071]|nr:hypothetical protein STTU_1934 [Streptomyces sp. Tu6071]
MRLPRGDAHGDRRAIGGGTEGDVGSRSRLIQVVVLTRVRALDH